MAPGANDNDGGERMSARAKRKAKEKANARKRAAAGNVVNPYAVLEADEEGDKAVTEEGRGGEATAANDGRPRTSHSDASGDTLVGAQDFHTNTSTTTAQNGTTAVGPTNNEEPPKFTPRDWTYDPLPSNKPPGAEEEENEDPDEPLTEAEIRHAEIKTWLTEQKGHAWCLKKVTLEKIADFVYEAKYGEDKAEWMRELRLVVWRCAVRASFWWVNPVSSFPPSPLPLCLPALTRWWRWTDDVYGTGYQRTHRQTRPHLRARRDVRRQLRPLRHLRGRAPRPRGPRPPRPRIRRADRVPTASLLPAHREQPFKAA